MSDAPRKCAACDNPVRAQGQRYCQKHHAEACKRYYQKRKLQLAHYKLLLTEQTIDSNKQ